MTRCIFASSGEVLAKLFQQDPKPASPSEPKCPNCGAMLKLKTSKYGLFYGCETWRSTKCRGSMRANPDGSPDGVPVDGATKDARMAAYDVFNQLWKGGRMTRRAAYLWLAERMNLPADKAHIGLLSNEQCQQLVEFVALDLTEDEQLEMAERELMGDTTPTALDEEDRRMIDGLPRDRDALSRKFRGGYARADRVCQLLRISIGVDEMTTIRNIFDALKEYDRRRSTLGQVPFTLFGDKTP